jgi:hypothetical protein
MQDKLRHFVGRWHKQLKTLSLMANGGQKAGI